MQHFVHYADQDIPLRFGICALEYVEEQLGGAEAFRENITKSKEQLKTLDALFVGMAKCWREAHGLDDDIPDEWREWLLLENMIKEPEQFRANRDAVINEMGDGYKSHKKAQEEEDDPFLAEARSERKKKKKSGSMSAREMISKAMICGFSYSEARIIYPGLMIDCYIDRMEYDAQFSLGAVFGGKKKAR